MSGSADIIDCPRCGNEECLHIYSDYKPHDYISGICLMCGFEYHTVCSLEDLDGVNDEREAEGLEPIDKLVDPLDEWIRYGYDSGGTDDGS